MAQYKVAIDAGHGGSDPGAVYNKDRKKMMYSALQWPSARYSRIAALMYFM